MRRQRQHDEGAVMVEFALVLPILLIILVGIIEFGIAYNRQITIQQAAREGARALALRPAATAADIASAETTAETAAVGVTSNATGQACPTTGPQPRFATMVMTADVAVGIPFVFSRTITLDATAKMRCGL